MMAFYPQALITLVLGALKLSLFVHFSISQSMFLSSVYMLSKLDKFIQIHNPPEVHFRMKGLLKGKIIFNYASQIPSVSSIVNKTTCLFQMIFYAI